MIILSVILLFLAVALVLALSVVVAQRWAIQDLTEEVKARMEEDDEVLENW